MQPTEAKLQLVLSGRPWLVAQLQLHALNLAYRTRLLRLLRVQWEGCPSAFSTLAILESPKTSFFLYFTRLSMFIQYLSEG